MKKPIYKVLYAQVLLKLQCSSFLTAAKQGDKALAREILREIEITPDEFTKMLEEL